MFVNPNQVNMSCQQWWCLSKMHTLWTHNMLNNTRTLAGPDMTSRLACKRIQTQSNILYKVPSHLHFVKSRKYVFLSQICRTTSASQHIPPENLPFSPPLWPVAAPAAAAAGWSYHTAGCRWPSARPAEPLREHAPLGTIWRGHRGGG